MPDRIPVSKPKEKKNKSNLVSGISDNEILLWNMVLKNGRMSSRMPIERIIDMKHRIIDSVKI